MVSHKRMAQGEGVRRNPELVGADRLAGFLKAVSINGAIDGVTRASSASTSMAPTYRFELGREMRQVFLGGPEAQFGRYHNAGGNVGFADSLDAIKNLAARMSDEVRHDLGVEQKSCPMK